jgi:hypothetical protein
MTNRTYIFPAIIRAPLLIIGLLYNACSIGQTIDSVIIPASVEYKAPQFLVQMSLGKNYRPEWQLPVKIPVFNLATEQDGLTITKLGGGHQTKSLRLISKDSTEWVLRSVCKNVRKIIPRYLQRTPAAKFAQDMVSASHPYACLSVAVMARSIGVTNSDPKLYYIPDDTLFGEYRKDFAGTVCFFEERHPLKDGTKEESTEDLLEELAKDNNDLVIQRELLKARLLDMVVGDWDRHQDQWRWGKYDSSNRTWYYPVAVDHDQAFFRAKGFLVQMVIGIAAPFLGGFKPGMRGLYQLNKAARNLDMVFLNALNDSVWKEVIFELRSRLTDSVIHLAVNALPVETDAARKKKLISVLQRRRDGLLTGGMQYYSRLAKEVHVFGSEKAELYEISRTKDSIRVVVYNCDNLASTCKIYDRTFLSKETNRVYLVGIDNNDKIIFNKDERSDIKLTTITAQRKEKYDLRGKILKRIQDNKKE